MATPIDANQTCADIGVNTYGAAGTVEDFSGANFTSVGYGATGFTGGAIGEVIVYDRELASSKRAAIQQYFAMRY